MRNRLKEKNLNERPAGRTLLAFSLAASLAAFGCTTNRTPGNGEPLRSGPGVGPAAPTSGVTTGSSSGTSGVQYRPMMSSSTYNEALPGVSAHARKLPLSPDEAAAVMAGYGLNRSVKVLGPANPGATTHVYGDQRMAQAQDLGNLGQPLNPIITVNSSINSVAHVPAVANDGGAGIAIGTGGVTAASTVTGSGITTGTTGATAGVATAGAATTTTSALTPTAATLPVTPTVTNTTLAPTATTAANPTPTVSSSGLLGTGVIATPATAASAANATNATVSTNRATATNTATAANRTVTAAASTAPTATATIAPIRITQDANGKVTVSNATSSRSQQK